MARQSWDEYFIDIAKVVSTRSTCPRLSVGSVLVRDRNILATGYNGSLKNAPHCSDIGCKLQDGHCIAAVHAEANALLQAARNGMSVEYATAYITNNPCLNCFKLLYQAGIKRIVYGAEIPSHLYKAVDYSSLGLNTNSMPSIVLLGAPSSEEPRADNY